MLRSDFVSRWIMVTLGVSLVAAFDGGFLTRWLTLVPSRVLHGELWRLVTWPLIEGGPLPLLLTCLSIYKFGGELAVRWGDRRLRRFVLQVAIAVGLLTCVLALLVGAPLLRRSGGYVMVDVLVIAWARQFPNATLVLYGMVTLSGQRLILATCAAAVVYAAFAGPIWMIPELLACLITARYPTALLKR